MKRGNQVYYREAPWGLPRAKERTHERDEPVKFYFLGGEKESATSRDGGFQGKIRDSDDGAYIEKEKMLCRAASYFTVTFQ